MASNYNDLFGVKAYSATLLATPRNIAVAGAVTGTAAFDGSSNISITTTLADSGVTAGTYTKVVVNSKGIITSASALLAGDVPTLNQNTTGNAATATTADKVAQSLTINGTAYDGSTARAFTLVTGAEKGAANGVATLDSNSKIPASQLPALAISDTYVVATEAAMLALTAERGDTAIRTDVSKTFILQAEPASTLANWKEMLSPASPVQSVAGKTGVVTLVKADVGLGNVDNTADNAKNVLSATKLTTSRTIALTGAATGTATAFDGSSNISIAVTSLNATSLTGTASVNTTGNAGTATKLQTPRTINGVAFDGSANITIDAAMKFENLTANKTMVANTFYSVASSGLTLTVPATLNAGDTFIIQEVAGNTFSINWGSRTVRGQTPDSPMVCPAYGRVEVTWTGSTFA